MTRDDKPNPLPGARSGDTHQRAREAERLFDENDRKEVEEANEALKRKRGERPSTLGDAEVEGRFGSPD